MERSGKAKNIIISLGLLCAMALLSVTGVVLFRAFAADPPLPEQPATTVSISSSEDLTNYAREYARGGHNPNDTIQLALSSAQVFLLHSGDNGFVSIGNADRPFNGTVEIADNAVNTIVSDIPLFGYVTTDAQILNASGTVRELILIRVENADTPLFAEFVTAGENNTGAHWIITLKPDDRDSENVTAYSFAGLMGTIGDDCKLEVEFTHDSVSQTGVPANVTGTGNIGLICGSLGENAELTVSIDTDNQFDITSTGGHAGGIAGVMESGSKLILGQNFVSAANVRTSNGYAGGLAGYATDATVEYGANTATVSLNVEGSLGAGGLFGYFKSTLDDTGASGGVRMFDLSKFYTDASFVLTGDGNVGGVFGMLDADNSVTIDGNTVHTSENKNSFDRIAQLNGGSVGRGGLIGLYTNNDLSNSLVIKNIKISASTNAGGGDLRTGGAIGRVESTAAVYIKIMDVAIQLSGTQFDAGLIGSTGDAGSFLDVDGQVSVTGPVYSGLVRYLNAGVLRIKGFTDFGKGYFNDSATISGGQLVGTRNNGLVYALGSGSDSLSAYVSSGWTFRRSGNKVDDIADWGDVLRNITETDFFTVDMANHTVTLAAAVNPMTNLTAFIKTALNIQHNVSGQPSNGALRFTSGDANKSTSLLGSNLSITSDINLAGTGITGLTRDNGTNNAYTGTFSGNSHTITLAIGENYGLNNSGSAVSGYGNNGHGTIIHHQYQGLFAKVQGATFTNLTIAGHNSTTLTDGGQVGGLAATSAGNLTLSGITTTQEIQVYNTVNAIYCGGAIGAIENGSEGSVSISNCQFGTGITDERGNTGSAYYGGAIGYVKTIAAQTFTFSGVTLSGTYSKASDATGNTYYGGLIGAFKTNIDSKADANARKVTIQNVTVSDAVSIVPKNMTTGRSGGAGAFLGAFWPNVDIEIGTAGNTDGVTVGNAGGGAPSISVPSGSGNGNVGVLFYKATGHMQVHHVKVNDAAISSEHGTSSFGFIVNDAIHTENSKCTVLYLDVDLAHYDIAATNVSGRFEAAYDEIVAYSKVNGTDLEANGQAIISLTLPGNVSLTMNGSACNTYQNQTSYVTKINPNTRYYYNLDSIRQKESPSQAEKLLIWSVKTYAHETVKDCFANGFTDNTISGTCDMIGLSYYPVDASGMTINSGTVIKFYNHEIEAGESGSGNTDSYERSTRSTVNESQHRLMHEGIFRNYTGNLTVKGLNVRGNVSNLNTGYSGFLICGTQGNADAIARATLTNVVLNGAYIDGTGYAPLLINKIGRNAKLEMAGVSVTKNSYNFLISGGRYAASSLIGDVGSDTDTNINLTFERMVLDSRTGALANETVNTALTTAYGTSRTIFSRATFMNSFSYLNGSRAEYNYEYTEDHSTPLHQVTYALEISQSEEFAGREDHYYGDTTHYTDPTGTCASAYDFSSGFLPHIYNWNGEQGEYTQYHEVRINLKDTAMTTGCGQYNDPYVITDGSMLATAAKIISGSADNGIQIRLPDDLGTDMWCDFVNNASASTKDRVYTFDSSSSTFKADDGIGTAKTLENVRIYLAGAYYSIETNVELPADFVGFGKVDTTWTKTNYECQYAFRGVVVGHGNTLTNLSANPLIKSANGCVVKDLEIYVGKSGTKVTLTVSEAGKTKFSYDSATCTSYGAVIGQVMGGDNIIDCVATDFTNTNIAQGNTTYKRLVPVGGYVGVVVTGGVIFRNMEDASNADGLTSTKTALISDSGWRYVNPIIGRVLAGYAFHEADAYAPESATLNNGTKGYGICDLNPGSTSRLTVTASAENNHVITVPDAQALYILSCIVNSGAGSASYSETATNAYPSISSEPWIGYRNYTSTRCGTYADVGSTATAGGDYAVVAAQDLYSGSAKVPYIIRAYTNQSGNVFHARSICGNNASSNASSASVASITLTENGSFILPSGYRGLGNMYLNNDVLQFYFKGFEGNGNAISLNMQYYEYNPSNENYCAFGSGDAARAGLGLFNTINNNKNADNSTLTIQNLVLKGTVDYEVFKLSNGAPVEYTSQSGNENSVDQGVNTVLQVGGLAGYITSTNNKRSIQLSNILIQDLSVSGVQNTGGLVGFVYLNNTNGTRNIILDGCGTVADSDYAVSVSSGIRAGGLIGTVQTSEVVIQNSPRILIDRITIRANNNGDRVKNTNHQQYGVGGLIAKAASSKIQIDNVHVVGKERAGTYEGRDVFNILTPTYLVASPEQMNYKDGTGGLLGIVMQAKGCSFQDVTIEMLNVEGCLTGGCIGYFYSTNDSTCTFANVVLDGGENGSRLNAFRTAAGLIGKVFSDKEKIAMTIQADSCQVKRYTLSSLQVNMTIKKYYDENGAATAFGMIANGKDASSTKWTVDISNFWSDDCELYALFNYNDTKQTDSNKLSGIGGLVSNLFGPVGLNGHNIRLSNLTLSHYKGTYGGEKFEDSHIVGYICGNNYSTGIIKLIGVSLQNVSQGSSVNVPRLVGRFDNTNNATNYLGTDGYVVMADYAGVATGENGNESNAGLYDSNDREAANPFVTVNPAAPIGDDLLLTGDGISATVEGLAIHHLNPLAGDDRYPVAKSWRGLFNTAKLSTYNTEQGGEHPHDFAVLIVDDVSRTHTTQQINSYINLLANTDYNYGADLSGVFSVDIYKMVYGADGFEKSNEEANLKRDTTNRLFYMNIDSVDTAGDMFSLIDVRFYDPADTDKVAYHLYIPVLVKKLLLFDFEIATGSGTTYERDWYETNERFGKALMENLGTPTSVFFRYKYLRSGEEWAAAANGGENLLRSYDKILSMTSTGGQLPADTILVLVDPNHGGQPYYARFGSAYAGGTLSLSAFHKVLDDDASPAFEPIRFIDMLTLTAAVDGNGTLVMCAENEATVKAALNGAETYFRRATEEELSQGVLYTVTVENADGDDGYVPMTELYYISFFTNASVSNVIYHYTISVPTSFNDSSNPSRIQDTDKLQNREGTVHLLLGNIFDQVNETLTVGPSNTEISVMTGNHVLTTDLQVTVKLVDSIKNEVQGYLGSGSGIEVFHSFVVKLTRHDDSGSRNVLIADSSTASGTYEIRSVNGAVGTVSGSTIDLYGGYAEIYSDNVAQTINDYLVSGNGATVRAQLVLDYPTDANVAAQFPNRANVDDTQIGTNVSASSNVAYDRGSTSFSKIAKVIVDGVNHTEGNSYYSKVDDKKAHLSYNVRSNEFVGDYGPLGINPLDNVLQTRLAVPTLAEYDIADIEENVEDYDLVKVTVSLYYRVDDYTSKLGIGTYLTGLTAVGSEKDASSTATEYVYYLSRSALESGSDLSTHLLIPIDLTVLTGAPFEEAHLYYSNYKVFITVELTKSADRTSEYAASQTENFIIYTNARVQPDFVDAPGE